MGEDESTGPYLVPGTRVRTNTSDVERAEYGYVTHCWLEDGIYDCHVALYENGFPDGVPDQKPAIVRLWSTSLVKLD